MAKFPTIDEFAKAAAEKAIDDFEYEGKTIREWVELILNGELAEVVHCKDCKHYGNYGRVWDCGNYSGMNLPDDNDFCSYGERRTE